ncbi:MAG: BON domain-containing protein [candidate division Zixibacteria bacterium]|nr:BON domain-containing protein [candidate division Zixibacteria bacterium]
MDVRKMQKMAGGILLVLAMNSFLFAAVAPVAKVVSVAPAQERGKQKEALKNVIEEKLAAKKLLQGDNIQVTVEDGKVLLDGTVNSLGEKRRVDAIVRRISSSSLVENRLLIAGHEITDSALAANVQQAIDYSVFYSVFDWIKVKAKAGVVTLVGVAAEPWAEDSFMSVAASVRGVKEVLDEVELLPVSIRDNEIRHIAATAIYRELFFKPLSTAPNPPVHIIVNNGNVILAGWVHSDLDRMEAESLVESNTMAAKITDNLDIRP